MNLNERSAATTYSRGTSVHQHGDVVEVLWHPFASSARGHELGVVREMRVRKTGDPVSYGQVCLSRIPKDIEKLSFQTS